MAKKQTKHTRKAKESAEMVQVDVYMIPAQFAEMYQVLREAVAEDVMTLLGATYPRVERQADPTEGEAVVAYQQTGEQAFSFYLSPQNVSEAQKARDKGHLDVMIQQMLEKAQTDTPNK